MRVSLIAVIYLCLSQVYTGLVFGEENKVQNEVNKQYQIVFAIFNKDSAGKFAYLRDSVQAMLASRLAARDNVTVVEKTFTEKELISLKKKEPQKALSIGGVTADYLVTGTLFALTSGLETQVDLYPLVPEMKTLHFSALSPTPDTLIADIEQLSRDIAQTAFGDEPDTSKEERRRVAVGGNEAFVTANPEEAYKRDLYFGTAAGVAGSMVRAKSRGAKITLTLPVDLRVMAVGDVTGDGNKEILFLSGTNLKLLSKTKNNLKQVAEISLPQTIVSHAMNTADLDGDGKEEIYISATDGLYVSSMILKYDTSDGFRFVAQNIPWYLRPLFMPGKGWQLAGQKRGVEKINLIRPGLYLLKLDANYNITNEEQIPLPTSVNLFDFAYVDLDGDSFYEVAVVDQQQKLRVYSSGNELMWVSQKKFAGSKIYLGPSVGGAMSNKNNMRNFSEDEDWGRELIFVPGRIIVTDINNDGKEELVVSEDKNVDPGFLSYFNRLRFYDSGAIVGLDWTGSTLRESWRTANFRGYIAGYGFTLLDEPRLQEKTEKEVEQSTIARLFVGSLPKTGTIEDLLPGGAETELTVYDLEFSLKKTEK